METKMTVIVDNVPYGELAGEWGLSILVEYDGKKILVDAGASPLFAGNMEKLGLDMADVDYAVLSHAHFDHANGMPRFFQGNSKAKFYVQRARRRTATPNGCASADISGCPAAVLEDYRDRIVRVSGKYELMPGAYLLSHTTPGLAAIGQTGADVLPHTVGLEAGRFCPRAESGAGDGQGAGHREQLLPRRRGEHHPRGAGGVPGSAGVRHHRAASICITRSRRRCGPWPGHCVTPACHTSAPATAPRSGPAAYWSRSWATSSTASAAAW